jgi:HAD superfamily hydrolase (TIGR01509 family)
MIKAVIFDMDGLMINSEPIQSKGFELLLREYHKKPIYHTNGLVHVVGTHGNCAKLKIKYQIDEELDILKQKRQQFYQKLLKSEVIKSMPGLNSLLKFLKKNDLKIAVATNSFLEDIKVIFPKLKILSYFNVFVTCEDVINGKPAPDIYLKAAKRLNIKPAECLVLEDSETGVSAGKNAGMKVIAVPNKFTKNHDFSKADLIVKSLNNIDWKIISTI